MASIASELDNTPRLPEDLERLIFEIAAYRWESKHSCKLLLVAKRVHDWIRPLVYQIFIQVKPKFPDFKAYPSLRLDDLGKYAKHLLLGPADSAQIDLFLSSCPNVQDLALWLFFQSSKHLNAIRNLRLTRLSSDFDCFLPQELLSPTFYNLTHLDIIGLGKQSDWDTWAVLGSLPKLSHLSISSYSDTIDIIHRFLLHLKVLKVLILLHQIGLRLAKNGGLADIDDERLVLMRYNAEELRGDWESGASGGRDFWMTAELFSIARKKRLLRNPELTWIDISLDWDEELNDIGKEWFSTLSL